MSVDRGAPASVRNLPPVEPTDADRLRALLARSNLSQRAAARLLGIEERTMRQWCAGQGKPPASVFRALSPRITFEDNLRQLIESNEEIIASMEDGRITGIGGAGRSDPQSITGEIDRLRRLNEEHRSLLRLDAAFQRKQEAYFKLSGQWAPRGSGLPSDESVAEVEAAEAEFRAAQAEVDRITQGIRAGER